MSVYIKGMEMPTSCYLCPCNKDDGFGFFTCGVTHSECDFIRLPTDCPLVPVPPHGRLIDADVLRQSIKESIAECHKWANEVEGGEMYARVSQSMGTFVECSLRVKAAPTIIPAEEGE